VVDHPNRYIREALQHAEEHGWSIRNQLRRRCPKHGDKWRLDEVFLTINGEHHSLWRAVDQDGHILDIVVQRHRDTVAAKTFFRKLLKRLSYVPRVIVTDQLRSYSAAIREILPGVEHGRLCRKIAFLRQNPKIGYQKINGLRLSKIVFQEICDRAGYTVSRQNRRA
jgi:transposase-like protein